MWFFISGESLPFRINVWTILLREFIRFYAQIPFVLVSSLESCLVQKFVWIFHSLKHMCLSLSVNFKQCCVLMSFVIKNLFAKYAVQFVCMRGYVYDIVVTTGEWDNLALYPDVCARVHWNALFLDVRYVVVLTWVQFLLHSEHSFDQLWLVST